MSGITDALRAGLDVLVVAWLIYWGLRIVRGTRAFRMLLALLLLVALYFGSVLLQLTTLNWLMDRFSVYLVLATIILFQNDIRRALARAGSRLWSGSGTDVTVQVIETIQRCCFRLAADGLGALIAVEREADLEHYAVDGEQLDSRISEDLLVALFQHDSPLHDGAVVVRGSRILAAGCFLPLSQAEKPGERRYGTRHRAARTLSEETDSLIFVVSEERGEVSLVHQGSVTVVATPDALRTAVQIATGLEQPPAQEDEELQRAIERAEAGEPPPSPMASGMIAPPSDFEAALNESADAAESQPADEEAP